ncbi:hypothetical protein ES705_24845 [subsurface metagenome]
MIESCKYCGIEIPSELLNSTNIGESILCESCGTKIIKEGDLNTDVVNRIDDNNQTNGFFRNIYERLRNRRSPIERVFNDSDFPVRFKDNFKIVVARLVFPHIRSLESETTQDIEVMELSKGILDNLYEKISPIMTQRVKDKFLINLHNLRVKEFDKWLKLLQKKIKVNNRYSQDFVLYLRWLIKEVFIIITELWDDPELPRFEHTIRDDLKSFEFNFNRVLTRKTKEKHEFNEDELDFLSRIKIYPNALKSKWEWLDNDLSEEYFKFVFGPYLIVNPRLRYDDFKALGFESFLRKLERDGILFSRLKSKIPISQEILEVIFDSDELRLKIEKAKRNLEELECSGQELPKPKLYSEVIRFLNLKRELIITGRFIPSLNNILQYSPQVNAFFEGIDEKQRINPLKQRVGLAVRNWIKQDPELPFQNLKELKEHFNLDLNHTEQGLTEMELTNLVIIFINRIKHELLIRYKGDNKNRLNDNVDEYLQFLTENSIDENEVIKIVLDKTTLIEVFNIAKIYEGRHRWTQATRCLQTIGLAILKCPEYDCLKKNLENLTTLKSSQVLKLIKEYIPLLKDVKSDIDVDKWLYKSKLFSLKKAEDLARDIGVETSGKPGIIEEPETNEEFYKMTKKYSPNLVPLKAWCQNPNHGRFDTNGNKLQQRHWCKKCKYDINKRIRGVISKIIYLIEDFRQRGLENYEIFNQILSESFITQFSMEIKRTGYIHSTQILRIIQVISLAILSSSDYYSLNENFKKLTNLSDNQVWRNINEYIPLLGEIFPEIDTDKWLLEPNSTIPRSIVKQFRRHIKQKVTAMKDGEIETPITVEEVRLESVQNNISRATAFRLTQEILGENYDKYFQTYTQYDRATFINELEQILEDNYHLATDLVLKLYRLTDLSPNAFVKNFYPKASFLVKSLAEHVSFRRKDTITKIKLFIDEYLTEVNSQRKDDALDIYYDYLHLKEKALIDNNLPFDFIWLENRILNIKNPIIQDTLLKFFEDFGGKKHPAKIFNNEEFTRASLLKLRGDRVRPISVRKTLNFFKENLKIIKSKADSPFFQLCEVCEVVKASNLTIDHPKILGRVLRDYPQAVAAEIPVWKKIFKEFVTGHIDLLLFDGIDLIIGDYKMNLRKIKEGLPQIIVYAMLLKNILKKYSPKLKNINIKCIEFCEDLAIEFDPEILGPRLLTFIELENKDRHLEGLVNLQTIPTNTLKIRKDLYGELNKVFNF